ncbi:MAG: hypothetical protein AUK55_00475 [Syntrophobacteraceae bacterium CG2_30_61_12]|nr:MAG: hypothetical protein AUK55_00475 [Syntrophobacteraceae bacterium CG2_30_61_12]PIU30689.1 MAG: hypothetical protein COT06_12240 [Syntrophobacteraceae bacterium CG07_land_8_20_14_0_80_61_8]
MDKEEILKALKKLPPEERLTVMETALKELRKELHLGGHPPAENDAEKPLAQAAEALVTD